jgi:hypothetical protein
MSLKPYITEAEHADKIAEWLRTRGGIAIWQSIDLAQAGRTLTTPLNTAEGKPSPKPVWWVGNEPEVIITDFADVVVSKDVEVKRFHVALRMEANGMKIKCTDASTRRIHAAIAKAGAGAYHVFDYETREAVILKPESQTSLLDYLVAAGKATGIHLVKTA